MAFLQNKQQKNQNLVGSKDFYSEGGGSQASQFGGDTGGSSKPASTAGQAGWVNVQDYIGANQNDQSVRKGVERAGQTLMGGAQQESGNLVQAADAYQRPDAQQFSQSQLRNGSVAGIEAGVNQQYTPQNWGEDMQMRGGWQGQMNTLNEGAGNPLDTLTTFAQRGQPQQAQYTPGMQGLDKQLLSTQTDFVNQYIPGMQEQFQSSVVDPLSQSRQSAIGAGAATQQEFQGAQDAWRGGVGDYLGEQQGVIDRKLSQMQGVDDQTSGMGGNAVFNRVPQEYRDMAAEQGIDLNLMNYMNITGNAPTRGQATQQALGTSGIGRYNALGGILNEYGVDKKGGGSYGTLRGEQGYTPRSWQFDQGSFQNEYDTQSQNYQDEQAAIAAKSEIARSEQAQRDQAQAAYIASLPSMDQRTNDALVGSQFIMTDPSQDYQEYYNQGLPTAEQTAAAQQAQAEADANGLGNIDDPLGGFF